MGLSLSRRRALVGATSLLVPLPLAVRAQPAYTVFVAGSPVRSCSMPVAEVGAADITTVEGVGGREAAAVPEGLDLA